MNDVFWIIFCVIGTIFLIFIAVLAIIDIWIRDKPKKKYYLIEYKMYSTHEIIMKAQSPLKARLKFQNKHPLCDLISLKEIKDE